ncbi:MAG: F0F1 ATP synthase subunit B' [Alphaproteobacteria bacterium]
MPQFDPTFFPSQLFWLAVCFGALYLLMSRVALPRIAEVVVERQRRVDDDLERAANLKAQTEAAIHAYEKALGDARSQAHDVLKASQDEIAKLTASRSREVTERLAAEIKAGEERIANARQLAVSHVREIATEVAQVAVVRLLGTPVDPARSSAAVDAVIRERG